MSKERQKVVFEFVVVENNAQTLVLDEPAGVTFNNISANPADIIEINNVLQLAPLIAVNSGVARLPGSFEVPTQQNEIDATTYRVSFPTGTGRLLVIKKYYVTK